MLCAGYAAVNPIAFRTAKTLWLTLLHSEWPKFHRVSAVLSAIWLKYFLFQSSCRRDPNFSYIIGTQLILVWGRKLFCYHFFIGGDQLSVTGTQFGSDVEIVFEDGNGFVSVESTRSSGINGADTVTFESPSNLMPGLVKLCVNIDGHGCAIVEGR